MQKLASPTADVELLVNDLWTSYLLFNTYFPRAYAHAIEVIEEDPYVLTKSLVVVEYRTAYNPKHYPIGVATQEMYTTDDVKKLMYDLTSGTALAVDTKPNAAGYYYAVETGSNVVPDPRVIFVIRTAIARASVNYLTLAGYAGKGNLGAFSKIGGGIPIRQALCRKVAMAPDYIDDGSDAYVPLQYIFEYYDADMNLSLTARQRRRWPSAEFVLHPTNNPDLATRIYMQKDGTASANDTTTNAKTRTAMLDVWARNSATTPEVTARVPFLYADFSAIDALVSWQT